MIEFEHVSKRYVGGFEALKDVSFQIPRGEMLFLTGRSGAGKSTLLKLIMLMERPSGGRIVVNGHQFNKISPRKIPYLRREIGVVFQNHQLLTDRSVYDNVALPLMILGYQPTEIGRRVRAALDKVGLLAKEKVSPLELSAGEQQRVGIARAIVGKPPVIIADEPTGNLDPQLSAEIMQLFAEFGAVGTTVLIASHDLHLVKRINKRVLVLDHGRLIDDYRPAP